MSDVKKWIPGHGLNGEVGMLSVQATEFPQATRYVKAEDFAALEAELAAQRSRSTDGLRDIEADRDRYRLMYRAAGSALVSWQCRADDMRTSLQRIKELADKFGTTKEDFERFMAIWHIAEATLLEEAAPAQSPAPSRSDVDLEAIRKVIAALKADAQAVQHEDLKASCTRYAWMLTQAITWISGPAALTPTQETAEGWRSLDKHPEDLGEWPVVKNGQACLLRRKDYPVAFAFWKREESGVEHFVHCDSFKEVAFWPTLWMPLPPLSTKPSNREGGE